MPLMMKDHITSNQKDKFGKDWEDGFRIFFLFFIDAILSASFFNKPNIGIDVKICGCFRLLIALLAA